jgi:hypothetical protein
LFEREKRQGIMKKILQDFIKTAKEQLFGKELPRQGKLVLSQKVMLVKMPEWGISKETLELTFEYGTQTYVKNGIYQVVRKYKYYSVTDWPGASLRSPPYRSEIKKGNI